MSPMARPTMLVTQKYGTGLEVVRMVGSTATANEVTETTRKLASFQYTPRLAAGLTDSEKRTRNERRPGNCAIDAGEGLASLSSHVQSFSPAGSESVLMNCILEIP